MSLAPDALRQMVDFGQESRGVEFKASIDWPSYETKFIKGAIAMANKRDGGVIIVGWDASNGNHGIQPAHRATYDIDKVQAAVNRCADPYIELELQDFEHNRLPYLALVIAEFREVPVISKRSSPDGALRSGALYVRSFRQASTTEVQGPEDMRELLDVATEKGIARFMRQARGAGLDLQGDVAQSHREAFAAELRRTFE